MALKRRKKTLPTYLVIDSNSLETSRRVDTLRRRR